VTYGSLKFRLTKAFPGVDSDLIEGWIADRYAQILAELPGTRTNVQGILRTTAPYTTGTVALTQGSAAISLTGGTWLTGMTGRAFRVGTQDEFYEFTWVSASTATLDRVYEGTTDAAAEYTIFQAVYPMPADCRMLEDDAFSTFSMGQMTRFSRSELNASHPYRGEYDTPRMWCLYMEDASTPPRMQVELYPIPDAAIGIPFTYIADGTELTDTQQIIQVWIQPAALVEGVTASIKAHLKDYAGVQLHEARAQRALEKMLGAEAQGMAPMRMHLSQHYVSHRSRRANRG
jgi:hypothetical protein